MLRMFLERSLTPVINSTSAFTEHVQLYWRHKSKFSTTETGFTLDNNPHSMSYEDQDMLLSAVWKTRDENDAPYWHVQARWGQSSSTYLRRCLCPHSSRPVLIRPYYPQSIHRRVLCHRRPFCCVWGCSNARSHIPPIWRPEPVLYFWIRGRVTEAEVQDERE